MMIERFEDVADKVVVPMSDAERKFLTRLLKEPSDDYKILVVRLAEEGCEFPNQQAALMLRNTPGAAQMVNRGAP